MNAHLQQRVQELLQQGHSATLATCGPAEPQISVVEYEVKQLDLRLLLPQSSDHLFNLETHPALVLLTANWRLHGHGKVSQAEPAPLEWQVLVIVSATRLHVLNQQHSIETIDF